jgi:hypothetical protein
LESLMRTKGLVAAVVPSFFVGESCCSSRAAAINPQELLVAVPLAMDVERSTNTVAYRVNETYPAAETTKALVDALTAKSCVLLPDDPFNPPPGFKFGAWDEVKLRPEVPAPDLIRSAAVDRCRGSISS